jgi:guanine deaminase
MDQVFMDLAISLATNNVESGAGGPFGVVVVRRGEIVATGANSVTAMNDPTAHAEVIAIRNACKTLESFQLDDCEIYSSCEPCPMCLGAIYWARPRAVYFATTKTDAADAGFDDAFIYEQIAVQPEQRSVPMIHAPCEGNLAAFNAWKKSLARVEY